MVRRSRRDHSMPREVEFENPVREPGSGDACNLPASDGDRSPQSPEADAQRAADSHRLCAEPLSLPLCRASRALRLLSAPAACRSSRCGLALHGAGVFADASPLAGCVE